MKKITAFFFAILPIFVITLLFATGMIVKHYTHVFVTSIRLSSSNEEIRKQNDQEDPTSQIQATVLPYNATNPEIYWTSSDENIATVDNNGKITAKDWGETDIIVHAKENEQITAKCRVRVWDNKVHRIDITNKDDLGYLGHSQKVQINAVPVPIPSGEGSYVPELKFKADSDLLKVSGDGWVQAGTENVEKVTVTITEDHSSNVNENHVDFHVGAGVYAAAFDTTFPTEISGNRYDFHQKLITAPDENSQPTDFRYESSDSTIATVDASGIVTFSKAGEVTITATHKWSSEIKVEQSISSTFAHFTDISFPDYEGSLPYDEDKEYLASDLGLVTYPQTEDWSNVIIEAEPSDVLEIIKPDESHSYYRFKTIKPGACKLNATVWSEFGSAKTDFMYLVVEGNEIGPDKPIEFSDGYNYDLRSAIDASQLDTPYKKIDWDDSKVDKDIATLDKDNDMLYFNKPGKVTISGSISHGETKTTIKEFTVECKTDPSEVEEWTYSMLATTMNMEAGKKYHITGSTFVTFPDDQKDNFYYDETDHTFIAHKGTPQCIVTVGGLGILWTSVTVYLNVSQKIQSLSYPANRNPILTTANPEVALQNEIQPTVRPLTARKLDENYKISYSLDETSIAVLDDNNILHFTEEGTVIVRTKVEGTDISDVFTITSTLGRIGKFKLQHTVGEETKDLKQIDSINLSPESGSQMITLKNWEGWTEGALKVEASEESQKICEFTQPTSTQTSVYFTLTPKTAGDALIYVRSSTYTVYLYVHVEAKITDINLYCQARAVKTDDATFTKTLNLAVITNPIRHEQDYVRYTFNSEENPTKVEDNIIKLDENSGWNESEDNILRLYNATSDDPIKTINLKYLTEVKDFEIEEVVDKEAQQQEVFMSAGSSSQYLTISLGGFIDSDFVDKHFTVKYNGGEEQTPTNNKVKINDQFDPNNQIISKEAVVTYKDPEDPTKTSSKTITIHRDIVSRISFPKNDEYDQTDKKGLQKVHVYGNTSYYTPAQGEINYYKLNINLYDYKGDLITDQNIKNEIFKGGYVKYTMSSLSGSEHPGYAEYHPADTFDKDGYYEVHFEQTNLYTPYEIANDAFATGSKTISFEAYTPSKKAYCKYSFITVDGVNAYCQEAILAVGSRKLKTEYSVLQTNFGLQEGAAENVPYTDTETNRIYGIYGNGYQICFRAIAKKYPKKHIQSMSCFNAILSSAYDGESLKDQSTFSFRPRPLSDSQKYEDVYYSIVKYCTFKNIGQGVHISNNSGGVDYVKTFVQKCLFYNNESLCVCVSGEGGPGKVTGYVEDCIFFNCSYAAISVKESIGNIKGFIDVYNFKNKEILRDIEGHDLTFLWDMFNKTARQRHMIQDGADGREYINSNMVSLMAEKISFYNWQTGEYESKEKGLPGSAEHMGKIFGATLPYLNDIGFWGTPNPNYEPGSPSYYDEFDKNAKLRWDFLNNQIKKVTRQLTYIY